MRSVDFVTPRDLGPRDWGTETLIVQTDHYIGKRLDMKAGTAGGLQYHVHKDEAFLLVEGVAAVEWDNGDGTLALMTLRPGQMVHVPPGAPHRVTAITDCVFYEWSTPHFHDRVRCEAEYGQPEAGGLPTTA
jgi:mannose-6-phosphate isomerase-like protein (cupin superfamily)